LEQQDEPLGMLWSTFLHRKHFKKYFPESFKKFDFSTILLHLDKQQLKPYNLVMFLP